ncbi:MAG TPA: adenylate/guanylate cyclase domain-containing protein [Candidatus Limnocylindria bacterium]|nr:adenylate/guanylate cyclase domain-containing protein [Candidatus Limnocylindria bacterium]
MPEERRVVTVLFADVTGSTAIGESSDPEDVRALLGRYYAIAREVIAAHGGTLEKFIGDAVMAVFGIPQAHGDDAERALAAALELRDRVVRDPQTSALALRIGVNTGEVVAARETAGGDFLVTGDAVNVAARLQQSAEPGAILVGERTCRAARGFRFGEEQRIAVKGKREPIGGSTLLERTSEHRAPRTPFFGREHDLAQLRLVAERAFSERRPQLVTITAPAGTGKSRLVDEFVARLGGGVTVATAQCLPYGAAVTFLPLRGLVRGLLGTRNDDEVPGRLRETFMAAGYAEDDAARLASLIGATLGDANERHDRDEIFSAWRLLIETLATVGPLVVVFEDLHWASDTLLDLVEHVTIARTNAPLVMVALARPELLDRRAAWGGGRRSFTSLALEPLSETETRALVNLLTEGVPGQIADRIVERAGGNPFFAGELVRAYEARRREATDDSDIVLPDTVHATVLARIDGLTREQREILEYAAVAGRTARASALRALLPAMAPAVVRDTLETLVEREFLVPQGAGAYTFRHIVIREVAYATLPRAERARAHVRLASWLEHDTDARANELAELVAYHYRQALALTPGGRLPEGLDVTTVIVALERAARVASAGAAYAEARQQIREAIRLAPEADRLRLEELLGDAMQFGDSAIGGYAEAFARWEAGGAADPAIGARLLVKRLGVAGRWAGSLTRPLLPDEFARLGARARELLDAAPDPFLEAKLACASAFDQTLSRVIGRAGVNDLLTRVRGARAFFKARGDAEAESESLDALAAIHRATGEYASALAAQEERLAMAERLGILERVDAAGVMLWDLVYLGRYAEAVDAYARARGVLRAGEPDYMLPHVVAWAAYAAMLCGRWDEALRFGDRLVEMRDESPVPPGRFTFPGWVAALRVASARQDTTRVARYGSAFRATANLAEIASDSARHMWEAVLENDARIAREALRDPSGSRDRKAELIALILFDAAEPVGEDDLRTVEAQAMADPPVLTARITLARALNDGTDRVRSAIATLDAGELVPDAARAATLLALRTHDHADRADAERRLVLLGDRAYLQKLAEEW